MERNQIIQAAVIARYPFGELHRSVTLLSPEIGLVNAIIYGGRKGKKASLAPLFSFGTFQIYDNPVKKEISIIEENSSFIPCEITRSIEATYAASYMCEVLSRIKSDDCSQTYSLLTKALQALENQPDLRRKIIIDFTYSLLKESGIGTDFLSCPVCDRLYKPDEDLGFNTQSTVPCCSSCRDRDDIKLLPGSRRYLLFTRDMSFEDSLKVELFPTAQDKLIRFLLSWITVFCNCNLKTVQSGLL